MLLQEKNASKRRFWNWLNLHRSATATVNEGKCMSKHEACVDCDWYHFGTATARCGCAAVSNWQRWGRGVRIRTEKVQSKELQV